MYNGWMYNGWSLQAGDHDDDEEAQGQGLSVRLVIVGSPLMQCATICKQDGEQNINITISDCFCAMATYMYNGCSTGNSDG